MPWAVALPRPQGALEAVLLSCWDTQHGMWCGFGVPLSPLMGLSTSLGPQAVSGPLWLGKAGLSWGSPRAWSHPLSPAGQRGPFMPCPVQERDWPRVGREGGPARPKPLCSGRRAQEKLQLLTEAKGLKGG